MKPASFPSLSSRQQFASKVHLRPFIRRGPAVRLSRHLRRPAPFTSGTAFPLGVYPLSRITFRSGCVSLRCRRLPFGLYKQFLQYLNASAQTQKQLSQAQLLQFKLPKLDLTRHQFSLQDLQPGLKLFSHSGENATNGEKCRVPGAGCRVRVWGQAADAKPKAPLSAV